MQTVYTLKRDLYFIGVRDGGGGGGTVPPPKKNAIVQIRAKSARIRV